MPLLAVEVWDEDALDCEEAPADGSGESTNRFVGIADTAEAAVLGGVR